MHDFTYRYVPDVTQYSKDVMTDAIFSQQAATGGAGGVSASRPPGLPGAPPGAAAAAAPATPVKPQRGFLLTMHVTTPNLGGDDYIRKLVIQKLDELGNPTTATTTPPPPPYRFIRSSVAIAHKVTQGSAVIGAPRPGRPAGPGGFGGYNPGSQITPTPPFGRFPGRPITVAPPVAPVAPVDPLADPQIPSESMKDDTEATLLVAVSIDPQPLPPPAAAAATPSP